MIDPYTFLCKEGQILATSVDPCAGWPRSLQRSSA